MNTHWIGQKLLGRYEIESLLGQGGMSAVYQATDLNLRRVVAVKMIHPHLSDAPEFVQRFESEATMVAQLRHPNIVQVFDFNHAEGAYFMVLDLIPGETLQARLKRLANQDRLLAMEEVVRFGSDVAGALDYAHNRGLIHRDVKPANILLDVYGNAVLTDFGVARMVGAEHMTATGELLGTAHYMSPEQVRGERVDQRTDIYAMGVMLFEMVSGRLPFEADSVLTVMRMHLEEPVPDLSEINPATPAGLKAVIQKALEKDPGDRYASAAELDQALEAALAAPPEALQAPTDQTIIEAPRPTAETGVPAPATEPATAPTDETGRGPEMPAATVIEELPTAELADVVEPGPAPAAPQFGPALQDLLKRVPVWGWGLGAVLVLGLFLLVVRPWNLISTDTTEVPATQPAPTAEPVRTEPAAVMPSATLAPAPTDVPTLEPVPTPLPLAPVTRLNADRLAQLRVLGQGTFISAAQSPDGQTVALGGSLGVWLYDLGDPMAPLFLDGHTDRVGSVAWSPDGGRLASGSDDTTVRIWDPVSGVELLRLEGHTRRVRTVAWSPDGRYLVSGGSDGDIRIWDPDSGAQLELLSGNVLHVWSVAWSPAADEVAWGGNDGLVRVQTWDGSRAGPLRAFRGHSGNVWAVHWSRDGTRVASVGEDGTARLWNAADGAQLASTGAGGDWVAELGLDPPAPILASTSADGQITVLALPGQTSLLTVGGFVDWITHLVWAPDGAWVAGASLDATVRIWDALSGEELAVLSNPGGPVTGLAVRAGDGALAVGGGDGSWGIWQGAEVWELAFQGQPLVEGLGDMAWSPDGRYLAMAGGDGLVAFWDTESEVAQILAGHQESVNGVAWSPDGARLASASDDNSVRIWDVVAGEAGLVLTGHSDAVTALAWSPDGDQLATVTADGRIRLWDPVGGRVNQVIEAGFELLAVAWSHDGELLVSASTDGNDGVVTVWDAGSGAVLRRLLDHRSAATSVGWSPDGALLASASREGAVRVWGIPGE